MFKTVFGGLRFDFLHIRHTRPLWRRVVDALGAIRRCEGDTFLDTVHTAVKEIKKTSRDAGSTMEDGLQQFRAGYEQDLPRSEAAQTVFETSVFAAAIRHFGGRVFRWVAIPALLIGCALGVGGTLLWLHLFGG